MGNYEAHELTSISFDAAVPRAPERRGEERHTALLRIGKLITGRDQQLCMIRNISSAGAMIRLYHPVAVGERVQVEPTPDCPVPAIVIWAQDDLAGIAFIEPIDVVAALRGGKVDGPYRRVSRTPRVRLSRAARMCTDNLECQVILCDVSLNGAKIETDETLATNTEVALFVEGLAPLSGRIRWCRNSQAGMEFDIPMQIDVLGQWIGADAMSEASAA
jgi:hypothetical protein